MLSEHLYNTDTEEGSKRGYLWYFDSFLCSLKWFNFLDTVNFSPNYTTPVQSMSITNIQR